MYRKDLGFILLITAALLGTAAPASAGCRCVGSYEVGVGVAQIGNDCNSARNLLISSLNNAANNECSSLISGSSFCHGVQSIGTCTVTSTQVSIQGTMTFGCWECTPKTP